MKGAQMRKTILHLKFILFCLCLAISLAGVSLAQQAAVSGVVKDSSAAVIPGATVLILKTDTAARLTISSNEVGRYEFPSLQPGPYEIHVDKAGFQPLVRGNVTLHVGDRVQIDLTLSVGDSRETVTVQGGQESLNTTDGSLSAVIDRQMVENMPLNGRSFQSLLNLTPGVNPINPVSVTPGQVQNAQGQFTVNGQRPDANYFMVDGVSANTGVSSGGLLGQSGTGSLPGTTALGGFNGLVSIDALQEFRITTSSFAPENGRTPGGQVSLLTRSGTDSFHGDLFDYLRNTILDANDWFLNRVGLPKGAVRQNDFGGVLGGPIVKNKLFFFLSYEGLRLTNTQPGTSYTFTRDARYLAQQAVNSANQAYSGYMAQILNAYPLPNHDPSKGDGSTCTSVTTCIAQFTAAFPNTSQFDSGSVRIDYALKSNMSVFGRYVHSPSSTVANGSLGSINNTGISLNSDSGVIGLISAISATTNNDLRFNYTRTTLSQSLTAPPGFMGSLGSLFPPGFAQPPSGYSMNDMLLSFNFVGLGVPSLTIGQAAANNKQKQINLVDTFSSVKGSHALKFGVDFRVTDPNVNRAPFEFTANFYSAVGTPPCGSGSPLGPPPLPPPPGGPPALPPSLLPQFICGKASNTIIQRNSEQEFRFQNWSLFAQDTWKIAPRLTLTYGARYEVNPAPHSLNGKPLFSLKDFDPVQCTTTPSFAPGTTICNVGINPLGTAPYPTTWGNVAPRIGVAWRISQDSRWARVLRAGFGVFYDTAGDAASATLGPFSPSVVGLLPNSPCPSSVTNPGRSTLAQFIQFPITNPACITPPQVQTNIGPDSPYTSVAQAAAPNLKLPRTYQFNLSVQQSLGSHQSLTLSYVGAVGRDLIGGIPMIQVARLGASTVTVPVSPTFPTFLVVYGNYAASDYNALQANFQRRFYRGLGATASYTWSHSLDDASNFNSGAVFPFSVNRSRSDFDIRQTLAVSLVYDAPTPFKSNKVARAILGHWSFDPIYHFQTAPPVNPIAALSSSDTFTLTTRPNVIPRIPVYVYGAQCSAEYGGFCPGGRGLNNAAVDTPLGATSAQAAAAGCAPGTVVGAFCRPVGGITPGAASGAAQGNAGRNSLRGFHLQQLDLAIHRDFPIGERIHLRFETDIFNVFNHPNFSSPSAILTDGGFGLSHSMMNASFGSGNASTGGGYNSLYTMGGPRAVQLAIKLLF